MAKSITKEVALQVASELPSFMKGLSKADLGVDSIGQEDVVIPRLKICQALSKVKKTVEPGHYYVNIDNADLGDKVRFVVCSHFKSKVWFDKKDRSFMGTELLDENGSPNVTGPQADLIMRDQDVYDQGQDCQNYMVVMEKDVKNAVKTGAPLAPVLFTCSSAALKSARQLNSRLFVEAKRGVPIYGHVIEATTNEQEFQAGSAFMPAFEFAGIVDQDAFNVLVKFHAIAKSYGASAKVAHPDNDGE